MHLIIFIIIFLISIPFLRLYCQYMIHGALIFQAVLIVQVYLPFPPTIPTLAMSPDQPLPVFSPLHQLSCRLGKYLPHLNLVRPVNCYFPLKTPLRHGLPYDFSVFPSQM